MYFYQYGTTSSYRLDLIIELSRLRISKKLVWYWNSLATKNFFNISTTTKRLSTIILAQEKPTTASFSTTGNDFSTASFSTTGNDFSTATSPILHSSDSHKLSTMVTTEMNSIPASTTEIQSGKFSKRISYSI